MLHSVRKSRIFVHRSANFHVFLPDSYRYLSPGSTRTASRRVTQTTKKAPGEIPWGMHVIYRVGRRS